MAARAPDALDRLKRHATRYGPDEVYDTAAAVLDDLALGDLARHLLRRLPGASWRLPADERARLLDAYLAAGLADYRIRSLLDVSQATIARRRAASAEVPSSPPNQAENGQCSCRVRKAESAPAGDSPSGRLSACTGCSGPLVQPSGRGRPRRFCSDRCRAAWHRLLTAGLG